MPRKPRVDAAGFHLVANKGVANRKIFYNQEDYDKFLEILCSSAKLYNFNVHSYSLLPNRYYILIETKEENISLSVRYINSNYAVYFNKKYNRVGHLWRGRYDSWYILNKSFLPSLVLHIEHYPIKNGLADSLKEYRYSSYRSFVSLDEPIECLRRSFIFKKFETKEETDNFFDTSLQGYELKDIIIELQKVVNYQKNTLNTKRPKPLDEYFNNILSKKERNQKIFEAYTDGYTQNQIAQFLNISQATVSNSIKKLLKENRAKIICI
jgi:REP element-mobilizing transposase RayT/DNA-binding CsgD family transcriptional regulator